MWETLNKTYSDKCFMFLQTSLGDWPIGNINQLAWKIVVSCPECDCKYYKEPVFALSGLMFINDIYWYIWVHMMGSNHLNTTIVTFEDTHWGKTILMLLLWQGFLSERSYFWSCEDTHRGKTISMRQVWQGFIKQCLSNQISGYTQFNANILIKLVHNRFVW